MNKRRPPPFDEIHTCSDEPNKGCQGCAFARARPCRMCGLRGKNKIGWGRYCDSPCNESFANARAKYNACCREVEEPENRQDVSLYELSTARQAMLAAEIEACECQTPRRAG